MSNPKTSDAAVLEATGKNWREWFEMIDRHNGKDLSHKEIVGVLKGNSGLNGWWQQMVTVEYEIARGKRRVHEMPDGYQISKSKTYPHDIGSVYSAWVNNMECREWLADPDFVIRKANENKSLRITWIDGISHVDVHFYPKADKTQVSINHKKLETSQQAGEMKAYWKVQLGQLSGFLSK